MSNFISQLHRFLTNQSFYPIALSSLLAFVTYFGRAVLSESWIVYVNLVWNLALAWVPYLFSSLASILNRSFPGKWWLLLVPAGIWLLFFPNAPYMVTDFYHLAPREEIPLWYDILMLSTFAWTGIFLAIVSLRTMQALVRKYLGSLISWLFAAGVLGLGGIGIYLGRFERWNSWDLLLHPRSVIKDIAVRLVNPLDNLRFIGFTLLFTAFMVVCYWMFLSIRHLENEG